MKGHVILLGVKIHKLLGSAIYKSWDYPGTKCKPMPISTFQDPKTLSSAGLPANLVSLMSKGALGATKLTEVSKTPKMDTETPAQKQAAAKLALRKQLEKTLLQVSCWRKLIMTLDPSCLNMSKIMKLGLTFQSFLELALNWVNCSLDDGWKCIWLLLVFSKDL